MTAGSWTDPWTGINHTVAAEVDIDHTVALANAHRTGGWVWTTDDKRASATDMTSPAALRPMGKAAKIAKSGKGPEAWRPPLSETWYDDTTVWATNKITWELTVTVAVPEHATLDEMFDTC